MNHVDVIVVGSGIAGLTATAYLSKEKLNVLLLEQASEVGGLLGAFTVDGHALDKGARSIIDSGIVFPMLRQLGIPIEFVANPIKITLGSKSLILKDETDIGKYGMMLKEIYPQNAQEIDVIVKDIYYVMKTMDVLYGIENPMFLPKPYKIDYIVKTLIPWALKFLFKFRNMSRLQEPINDFLRTRTKNEELINIITQHFFSSTPTFFALSYFTLYLQYHYPKGSSQVIVDRLKALILKEGGKIETNKQIIKIDVEERQVETVDGQIYAYDQMIWAADTNVLYKTIDTDKIRSGKLLNKIEQRREFYKDKIGADSVLTIYMTVDLPPSHFESITGPHCFYTPRKEGLSAISLKDIQKDGQFIDDRQKLFDWVSTFVEYNTLEVSIPSLRDQSLSPQGQTGLIVSILFDYHLAKHFDKLAIYEEFKQHVTQLMVHQLSNGYIANLDQHILKTIVFTPLSIERKSLNTHGSLTGWSFANKPFPATHKFIQLTKSVLTAVDSIKQAGQWAFNPAGVPVSILTAKLATDAVINDLRKSHHIKKGGTHVEQSRNSR
jgi:phytoene dehydrogenase-like protein